MVRSSVVSVVVVVLAVLLEGLCWRPHWTFENQKRPHQCFQTGQYRSLPPVCVLRPAMIHHYPYASSLPLCPFFCAAFWCRWISCSQSHHSQPLEPSSPSELSLFPKMPRYLRIPHHCPR